MEAATEAAEAGAETAATEAAARVAGAETAATEAAARVAGAATAATGAGARAAGAATVATGTAMEEAATGTAVTGATTAGAARMSAGRRTGGGPPIMVTTAIRRTRPRTPITTRIRLTMATRLRPITIPPTPTSNCRRR